MEIKDFLNRVICGDTLEILQKMPSDFVDCIITSPPYWGLRDYGVKGQLGLEPTLEEYLEKLLKITAELKRVLKKMGVMFWNHGDCYGSKPPGNSPENIKEWAEKGDGLIGRKFERYGSFKKSQRIQPKCLALQNWRLILRMIDEQGWILRNTLIWYKPNAMPSCLDKNTEVYVKSENGVIASHSLSEIADWNIENLKILSPMGWKRIKNIWKVKKREYIKFQFGTSGEIICSLDHKFPISHDNRRKRYEIKLAKDLREDKHKLLDRLLFIPINKFLDGKYTEINGEKLDYELGKFIGLIVAEGGFNSGNTNQGKITLNKDEKDLMTFFVEVLNKRFNQYNKIYYKDNYQSIQFSSKTIKELYQKLVIGKCINKSLDKVYFLNSPFEFRRGLFDGIIVGDGHTDKRGRITYGTASKQLRDDIYLLASSIGLLASKHENHRKDKRTNKIYDAYYLTIPLSLQREVIKGEQVKNCYWNRNTRNVIPAIYQNVFSCKTLKIYKIEAIKEKKELIDIEVEGGLFLINGGLVSHNSVKDRFANKYEPVFILVKNKKYWFDLDAVRAPYLQPRPNIKFNYRVQYAEKKSVQCPQFKATKEEIEKYKKGKILVKDHNLTEVENLHGYSPEQGRRIQLGLRVDPEDNPNFTNPLGKNPGDVWQIATQPCPREFRGVHFATFPEKLVEPMILAGCPKDGIVLDPFCGLGTVGVVAKKLKRNFIGIDIKEEYCEMARQRIRNTPEPLF